MSYKIEGDVVTFITDAGEVIILPYDGESDIELKGYDDNFNEESTC